MRVFSVLIVASVLLLTGCGRSMVGHFYVESTPIGYVVAAETQGGSGTIALTDATTVEKAKAIADKWNRDLDDNRLVQ